MSTNFYAILPIRKKLIDKIKDITYKIKSDKGYVLWDAPEDLYNFREELGKNVVHLGKRSGGWVFCWDGNNLQHYKPTLESIKKFIDDNNATIMDEYERIYTWDQLINDELKDILYDTEELYNSKRYHDAHPDEPIYHRSDYNKQVELYKEYGDINCYDVITKEGLRFALYTDFS